MVSCLHFSLGIFLCSSFSWTTIDLVAGICIDLALELFSPQSLSANKLLTQVLCYRWDVTYWTTGSCMQPCHCILANAMLICKGVNYCQPCRNPFAQLTPRSELCSVMLCVNLLPVLLAFGFLALRIMLLMLLVLVLILLRARSNLPLVVFTRWGGVFAVLYMLHYSLLKKENWWVDR